jgi:hypothetical protein
VPPSRTFPARLYATPEYRAGYAAGCRAARGGQPAENPFLPQDLRHVGWTDASYDNWSARRVEIERVAGGRAEFRPKTVTGSFASRR